MNKGTDAHPNQEEQVREFKQAAIEFARAIKAEVQSLGYEALDYPVAPTFQKLLQVHSKAVKQAETAARIDECERLSKASGGGDWRRKLILRQAELKGVSGQEESRSGII